MNVKITRKDVISLFCISLTSNVFTLYLLYLYLKRTTYVKNFITVISSSIGKVPNQDAHNYSLRTIPLHIFPTCTFRPIFNLIPVPYFANSRVNSHTSKSQHDLDLRLRKSFKI